MELLPDILGRWMKDAFVRAFPEEAGRMETVAVVAAANPEFGDYQCNAAMPLAKALRQPPRKVAETVLAGMEMPSFLSKVEVAGPGFINLFLSDAWMVERLVELSRDPRLGAPEPGLGRTVVMDYGSPNITKPLHIGHLRSHNIGSAIDRLHRFLGYRVIADNHLGDWGTQFGVTIMGYRHFGDPEKMRKEPLEELERVYVLSYEKTKTDPEWLARCREELVKLQSGDPENVALWRDFTRYSIEELEHTYGRLGIKYDLVRGESHYRDKLLPTVEFLAGKGLTRISEGATVVDLEEEGLPLCIVRKSDGGFNYATSDIATVRSRIEEFMPDRIVYVTDERQQLHFRQVFAICRRLGIETALDHVWFGLMRLPEGTFSTREGNVIPLERLLDEAVTRAKKVLDETSPEMPDGRKKEVAEAVGIGAVKYADLSQNPQSLVTFTWEKALALDGNSGPYLQYAYARIASVLDKYGERFPGMDLQSFPVSVSEQVERTLVLHLLRFGETVRRAAEAYKPSVLCDYLYELAGVYSSFYQNVPFLKADEGVRESRVRICGITASVLGTGLKLLGIRTPERI